MSILNKSPEETTKEDVDHAKYLFGKHGSIEYSRKRAEEFGAEAKKIADSFPPRLKDILYFFTDYVVSRKK